MRLRTLFLTGFLLAALIPVSVLGWANSSPHSEWAVATSQFVTQNFLYVGAFLSLGAVLIFYLLSIFLKRAVKPIELAVTELHKNAESQHMTPINVLEGRGVIREFQDLQDSYNLLVRRMTKSSVQLKRLAYVDGVTDLPNREKFQDTLQRVVSDETLLDKGGAVIFVDMDNFKEINDLHGHDVGDRFLRSVAQSLSLIAHEYYNSVRQESDVALDVPVVSRIGGDEFTLLVPGLTEEAALNSFLDSLRRSILQPKTELNFLSNFGGSIGCARYPQDGTTAQELFKRSDIAMYHAKSQGKNTAVIFKPEIGTQTEAELRRDVLLAIENDELFLEYQPKVHARDRSIAGVEALVRWNHSGKKVMAPSDWLPAIANSHVMIKLGNWVLECAMRDHAQWVKMGFDLRLAVNIGANHFTAPDFLSKLRDLSSKYDFNPSSLEIEVSEDVLFGSGQSAANVLVRLRDFGYTVSIDDFGKGYSNLARLADLQVDYIKLDRSMVSRAQKDPRVRSILSASINIAKELGCETVAEGVESVREVDFITHIGADMLQGYYFSKSMPARELVPWLQMYGKNNAQQQRAQLTKEVA